MYDKEPVVIDTDPGIDDFLAIAMANKCEKFDIRAIMPVAGNQRYEKIVQNALDLVDFLGMDCPVTKGASKPLIVPQELAPEAHGETGLGYMKLPRTKKKQDDRWAWDVLYEEAKKAPGRLHVITLGPLTNVAIALLKYPELVSLIGKLTVMGGSGSFGNHSAYGEFNIWVDPHAAAIVFRSGIKFTMCGLDGNTSCKLTHEDFNDILAHDFRIKEEFRSIVDFVFDRDNTFYAEGPVIHDAVTVASLIDEDVLEFVECYTDVEYRSTTSLGRTIADVRKTWGKEPNSRVAVGGNLQKCKQVFLDAMLSYQ